MEWEYKIINPHKDGNPNSEFELNELGKEGWELVTISDRCWPTESWYFKRHTASQPGEQEDALRGDVYHMEYVDAETVRPTSCYWDSALGVWKRK